MEQSMKRGLAALAALAMLAGGPAFAGDDKAPAPAAPDAAMPDNPDAVPSPAPEQTARAGALLQMFQTFCRGTYAGQAAILAAAERQGFRSLPASELKSLAGFAIEDLQLRANTVDGVRMLVAAGRGRQASTAGQPSMDVCIVGVTPTETGAAGRFGHWAGVEPVSGAGVGGQMFMFVEGPEGRRSVTAWGVGDMRRHVRDGDVQLLLVGDQDGSTLAIYGVMRPEI